MITRRLHSVLLLIAVLVAFGEYTADAQPSSPFVGFMKDKTFVAALDGIRIAGRLYPDGLDFTVPASP